MSDSKRTGAAAAEDPALAFSPHDHRHCMGSVIRHAEEFCARKQLRLTPVRRRVLEILLESHKAMGAYDVLERLAADGFGHQPPVAYRALEFLVAHGLAHRIQRLNAFAACMNPDEAHDAAFLICRDCNTIAEAPALRLRAALDATAIDAGFAIDGASIEAVGQCAACRADNAASGPEA